MSTDQLSPRRAPRSRGDTKLVGYDEYIDTQVESTRRLVKVVDLATSLVLLAVGVLAFLLTAAVVEHWLVPGGFPAAVRSLLFALLVGGVGYFAYRRVWPLCIHAINPVYAAQTIEQSGPTLKNSLINLLLFRQKRSEISDAVYQTLEEQAAQRLSRVPVEAAVDRSLLIRFGYMLLAIVAVASLYKVFSPKDPLVAAQRVLMPWADIVPASRVSISAIEPGSVTVSRGEFVDVSAEVRGIGESDPVLLRYTTDDGQALDKPLPMKLSSDGLRFEARLPDGDEATSNAGVAHNLRYRIEAGDARSLDYAVKVVPAPSILVERVEYDYPAYTGYVDRVVDRLGDIRAIEGTSVTIHTRANGPINEAHVDFDADGRRDLRMTSSGVEARASFVLALRDDRQTPQHASYVVRFTNREGRTNRDPVKYPMNVEPDYGPEAAILLPQEKELDVRLDETVTIEVEARDPDFALSEVRLRGEVAGRAVIDEPLLARGHSGRFTARHSLTPSALNLRAGDVVQYWATANDNRTPKPNSAASERKLLRIVSPDPGQKPPPDRLAQRDPQQRQQEQPQDGQQGEVGNQDGQSGEQQPGSSGGEGENQQSEGQQGQGQQGGEQGEGGKGDKETGRQGESDSAPQAGGEAGTRQPDEPGARSPARTDDAAEQQRGENQPGAQGGQGDQLAKPGEQDSNNKQTGAGAAGGEPSQDSQPAGTRQPDEPGAGSARPDQGSGERSANGGKQGDKQQSPSNAEPAPVSSEGDNDAEAFDRIQRHLKRDGKLEDGDSNSGDQTDEQFSRDAEKRTEVGERGRQGEGETERDEQSEQSGEQRDDSGDGPGADAKNDDLRQPKEQPGGEQDQTQSPGGQQTSSKGPSGAGDEQKSQGAPDSQPEMKPGEKRQQSPSQGDQSNEQEPPAGARGKKESDSQGEEGGDRAGGGEEGGGQKAPREGTGSAGANQSADEGAGESSEQGTGNNSPNAGQDAKADKRTGESGRETPGRGSKTRGGEGEQPGGEGGVKDDPARGGEQPFSRDAERSAEPGQGDKETRRQGDRETGAKEKDANQNGNRGGAPSGDGGETGTDAGPPERVDGTVPDGDAANLEYARKQTDLVLEKLADQLNRKRVDERLLDKLGWSEDDLRKFVERWQARKQAAQRNDQSGDAARRELDEALRSLGLRRGRLEQNKAQDDALRDLREGYRGPVPLEYQERLRAYNQGVSRARQDGE